MENAAQKKIECFEDLIIWQRAVEFAVEIYTLTESAGIRTDFGLNNLGELLFPSRLTLRRDLNEGPVVNT